MSLLPSAQPSVVRSSFLTFVLPLRLARSNMNSIWVTVDAPVGGKREADLRVQLKENPVSRAHSLFFLVAALIGLVADTRLRSPFDSQRTLLKRREDLLRSRCLAMWIPT